MKRDIYLDLKEWKNSNNRKPLILRGARQVGKTYILKEFAKSNFQNFIYVNFEEQKSTKSLFENNLDPHRIISDLSLLHEKTIDPTKTLIIFDEIQACQDALNSLKYFHEKANNYHIIAAGSLLGVKMGESRGFPVGQIQFLDLYPLSFFEFLNALRKDAYRSELEKIKLGDSISEIIHEEVLKLLRLYFVIGGMPAVVKSYRDNSDLFLARTLQNELLNGYKSDFAKYASLGTAIKISNIWESIPAQLAKDNKKFIFKVVTEGARAREYEMALTWLIDAGLIYKLENIETSLVPLIAHKNRNIFKIFFLDIGLLGAFCNLHPSLALDDEKLFSSFNGAIAENFVMQELIFSKKSQIGYWTSAGIAEVDFIFEYKNNIYPLEVKYGTDKRKKSLKVYADKYTPRILSRVSRRNLKLDGNVLNYPLYLISRFPEFYY
jgi:uncharacterized protein